MAIELARQGCQVLVHYNERLEMANETANFLNQLWDNEVDEESGRASIPACAGILQCDFRSLSNLQRFQREIDDIWPEGYDILINNAGIIGKLAMEDDNDMLSHWNEIMAVNLHAPRWFSQSAVSRMKRRSSFGSQGGGTILHVQVSMAKSQMNICPHMLPARQLWIVLLDTWQLSSLPMVFV